MPGRGIEKKCNKHGVTGPRKEMCHSRHVLRFIIFESLSCSVSSVSKLSLCMHFWLGNFLRDQSQSKPFYGTPFLLVKYST